MKVALIGKGNVGKALAAGLDRLGHEFRFGHRDPRESVRSATAWGELIVLAVPFSQVGAVVKEIGRNGDGKTLIDATNAVGPKGELAVGFTTSGAEELQRMLPPARVIKAFNTVLARDQGTGKVNVQPLTAFLAGDDAEAKRTVMELTRKMGFEPADYGPLLAARYLEPMAMQIIALGHIQGRGTNMGYRIIRG